MATEIITTIEQELSEGKSVTYYTIGRSMKPLLIERKTHVCIAPFRNETKSQVSKLAILLYKRANGTLVLHRLIKKESDCYYMMGDNTIGLERIEEVQILGVVTGIYRKGKFIDVEQNRVYRMYANIWLILYPLRWLYRKCGSVFYHWRKGS